VLMCLDSTINPFSSRRAYREIAVLPLKERVLRMRDPEVRAAILAEPWIADDQFHQVLKSALPKSYDLGDPPDYEPPPEASFAHISTASGRTVEDVAYDVLLRNEGKGIIYFPTMNYSYGNLDSTLEMMEHPLSRLALGDGGAHCGFICDVSLPTFMLTHWTRDRTRGRKLSLERAVHMQTGATSQAYGLLDRGILRAGYKADINVIDYDNLHLHAPEMVDDLPAGGRRFVQRAAGYDFTICSGATVFESGEATGDLPGRLIRGRQRSPR
jgi:N-acyl-D-amino-acid deacylase